VSFARFLPGGNLAASLYGLVLVTSVLAVLGDQNVELMALAIVITSAVFALTHAWAHALSEAAKAHTPLDRHRFRHSVRHEWPIVEAALPSAVIICLAAPGLYSTDTAVWVALAVNVLLLFAWGAGLRELAGATRAQTLVSGMSTAALGLALIALKILVH
jgi:hypothetical protein